MLKVTRRKVLLAFLLGTVGVFVISSLKRNSVKPAHNVALDVGHTAVGSMVQADRPTVTLMMRLASEPWLTYQFYCMFLRTATFFWPAFLGDLVIILDDESLNDHKFGDILLQQFYQYYPDYKLKVLYEPLPRNTRIWDFDNSRGAGYNRQLYSTFISDLYTDSDVIVYMDADTQFRTPITPAYLFDGVRLRVYGNSPLDTWWMALWVNSTQTALGRKMVANFMVTFPQVIYKDTFRNCRRFILKRFNTTDLETAMLHFHGPGRLLSPINIIMNYAWYYERARYDWHLAIDNVTSFNMDLQPQDYVLPSDMMPGIVAVPHILEKRFNQSLMDAGYCSTMSAIGEPVPGCSNVTHDYNLLCHFYNSHHRLPWQGVGEWCEEGVLEICCEKAARKHYADVAEMVRAGLHRFSKNRVEWVEHLAEQGSTVPCEPLNLP